MSNCYHCKPDPCICRHLGEVMTQPQSASVTISAVIENESSPKIRLGPKFTGEIRYAGSFFGYDREVNGPWDEVKKHWHDAIEEYTRAYYRSFPSYKLTYNGDRPFDPVSGDYLDTKSPVQESPVGLSSGVAIAEWSRIADELAVQKPRRAVVSPKTYAMLTEWDTVNGTATLDLPDYDDDYSDFLDESVDEDDDE